MQTVIRRNSNCTIIVSVTPAGAVFPQAITEIEPVCVYVLIWL
jgi:hypothetical protein